MTEYESPKSLNDRKITWGLMAIVVVFVLLMTCIVLWITSSLIRNETGGLGQSNPSATNTQSILTDTPVPPTNTPEAPTDTPTATIETPQEPILVEASWTPDLKKKFVSFLYYYVKPNQIELGECIQIHWEVENAISLQLYRDGELILEDPPLQSTLQDCPTKVGYVVYRMVGLSPAENSSWIQLQVRVKKAQ